LVAEKKAHGIVSKLEMMAVGNLEILIRGVCMSQGNELERLEGFVAKLLVEYNGLREEKEGLLADLHQREEKIAALESELASAQTERSDVGSRVKGLIKQIEAWESSLGENEPKAQQKMSQESRMQRNLFSVGQHEDNAAE
jgi:chromosome segregation ATPase